MASEKITRILLAKSPLSKSAIEDMTDREAWAWLYEHFPPKTERYNKSIAAICFTGFSISDRAKLEREALDAHLHVVKSVTKTLRYLVAGENAGPAKLEKAKDQDVVLLNIEQFRQMLDTGELPIFSRNR